MGGIPLQLGGGVNKSTGIMILMLAKDGRPVLEVSINVCASTNLYALKDVLLCFLSSAYL